MEGEEESHEEKTKDIYSDCDEIGIVREEWCGDKCICRRF